MVKFFNLMFTYLKCSSARSPGPYLPQTLSNITRSISLPLQKKSQRSHSAGNLLHPKYQKKKLYNSFHQQFIRHSTDHQELKSEKCSLFTSFHADYLQESSAPCHCKMARKSRNHQNRFKSCNSRTRCICTSPKKPLLTVTTSSPDHPSITHSRHDIYTITVDINKGTVRCKNQEQSC